MSWKHNSRSYDYDWQTRSSGSLYRQPHQESELNTVYVKGACKNNGREAAQGGIGVYWRPDHDLGTYSGWQTNQRASLEAAIKGIEQAKTQHKDILVVCTDNQLITKGMNGWINNWKENGWKTNKNKDVNRDQFTKLDNLTQDMNVEWKYAPAYSKVEGNVEAQRLARGATRKK